MQVRSTFALFAAAALTTLLSACATDSGTVTDDAQQAAPKATPTAAAAASKPAVKPTAAAKNNDSTDAKIGSGAVTYKDGLKVQVVSAKRTRFSEYAAGAKPGDIGILLTVRITNGTGKKFDPALTTVELAVGEDGVAAEDVYDESVGQGFTGAISVGKKQTQKFGFAVPKGTDVSTLQVSVSPDPLTYDTATFEGKLG